MNERRPPLNPPSCVALAAVLLFFVVSGTIAYLNLRTIRDDSGKVARSRAVIVALDDLFESAQRGFLLTGNESYLLPYDDAVAVLPSELDI